MNEPQKKVLCYFLSRSDRYAIIGVTIALTLFFLPFIILRENSYFTIWDTLDSDFVYPVLLKISGQWLNFSSDAVVENVFNGLPRSAVRSGLSVTVTLFQIFPPHFAFIINFILVHLIAFAGMFFLLKGYFLKDATDLALSLTIALLYAFIPFYSIYGISFAGQPLLFYCFLNILYRKGKWTDWLCIVLFPFYSFVVLTYPFYVVILLGLFLIDLYKQHKPNISFILGVVLLGAVYCLIEYQMINAVFIDELFIPHRAEFDRGLVKSIGFMESIKRMIKLFFHCHFHAGAMWTFPVLIVTAHIYFRNRLNKTVIHLLSAFILIILLLHGFYEHLAIALKNILPFFNMFQFDRMYILLPCIWLLLFGIALKKFMADYSGKKGILITTALWAAQAILILSENTQFMNNSKLIVGGKISEPSYREFFARNLFADVERYINQPKQNYRVVSIGMHPSIAQFNGFYTLDGYFDLYPVNYKHEFRKIIARELEKNKWVRKNYDGWGNRVYIMPSELEMEFLCGKNKNMKVRNLELDMQALKNLGGQYIFSAVEIENWQNLGLRFENKFTHCDSYWDLYLYSVI